MRFHELSFALGKDELRRIDRLRRGYRIVCARGVLWVTLENDPTDYILHEGEDLTSKRRKGILLHALSPSEVRLLPTESGVRGPVSRRSEPPVSKTASRRISVPLEHP